MENKFTVEPIQALKRDIPFLVEALGKRKRTLEIGNVLKRKRKGYPYEPSNPWAIVRDVITAVPATDSTAYVAVLCEGVGELSTQWFVWRTYFTNNRHGRLHFGQFGPQAPLAVDKWLQTQILERGWYANLPINSGVSQAE
jgi:hypothetical protein